MSFLSAEQFPVVAARLSKSDPYNFYLSPFPFNLLLWKQKFIIEKAKKAAWLLFRRRFSGCLGMLILFIKWRHRFSLARASLLLIQKLAVKCVVEERSRGSKKARAAPAMVRLVPRFGL